MGQVWQATDTQLNRQVYDPDQLQVGPAVPVLEGYRYDPGGRIPQVAVSQSGTLAYVAAGHSTEPHSLEWVSADGTLARVGEHRMAPRPSTSRLMAHSRL